MGGTACSRLGPPISITNQENVPQAFLQVKLMGHCLNWGFLFPKDPSLCQADKKLSLPPVAIGGYCLPGRVHVYYIWSD